MANVINATSTGNGGLVSTGDDSGILNIQTNETTAITVDASQIVSYTNNLGTVAGYPAYQCRAWVNFNGTGTVAIRASGNVTSLTDNGVGSYTVTMTTAMPDTNFVGASSATLLSNNYSYVTGTTPNSTTTFSLNVVDINGTQTDPTAVQAVIFR